MKRRKKLIRIKNLEKKALYYSDRIVKLFVELKRIRDKIDKLKKK